MMYRKSNTGLLQNDFAAVLKHYTTVLRCSELHSTVGSARNEVALPYYTYKLQC